MKKGDTAVANVTNSHFNDELFGSYISVNENSMLLINGTGGTTNLFGKGLLMLQFEFEKKFLELMGVMQHLLSHWLMSINSGIKIKKKCF